MGKNNIFWTPIARDSLKETKAFILKTWDNQVLNAFLELVDRNVEQIQNNPGIAPKIIDSGYRKLVIHKNVSLFYSVKPDLIKILLIWDNRQDPKKLKDRLLKSSNG